jgi:hypothetical protein
MKLHREPSDQLLIAEHVNPSWGRADARLKRSGVSVWSLIGYLRAFEGDGDRARNAFNLTPEEMSAAPAYYRLIEDV